MAEIQFAPSVVEPGDQKKIDILKATSFDKDRKRLSYATEVDVESSRIDEYSAAFQPGDIKKKQTFTGTVLLWLAYQSIGVIYGDIGTSPLYVYSSTFTGPPSNEDLLGALSLIIWTLTLMVSIKYVCIVLSADDEGEGGSFALYSLISRYTNILQRNPRDASSNLKLERYLTTDMKYPNSKFRQWLEQSATFRSTVKLLSVLGVSLVVADGVLTPAQSVLGAIQGLKVVAPDITTEKIVGISCVIIVVLFLVQPFGTSKIGSAFAPVVILWLLFNLTFGVYNLVRHDYLVLKAFSPYFAGQWFVRNKTEGWKSLGGILLAFTGVEALFADLGAFSARAVRLSWLGFAFPCLLMAYIGQAAHISVNRDAYSNPFFNTVPPGMFWPSFVLSILAAFVASQAMITGAFQLISQTIQMSYFPNIKIVHTSHKFHSQIYVPMANWLMMVATILVTVVYNNTTSLGNAYGVCVVIVTFITTCLVSVVAMVVWRLHPVIVVSGFVVFGTLDCLYLTSALTKVPAGAWFTILVAGVLSSILLVWRYGKNSQWSSEGHDIISPQRLVTAMPDGTLHLRTTGGNTKELRPLKGLGVFFDKAGHLAPAVYTHFLRKFEAVHDVTVFFHVRHIPGPHVPASERYSVVRTGVPATFRIIARQGYADSLFNDDLPDQVLGTMLLDHLREFLEQENKGKNTTINEELEKLERAYRKQVVYIFGKEKLVVKAKTAWVRAVLLNAFVWMRENTRGKPEEMKVEVEKLVEVGFVKEI